MSFKTSLPSGPVLPLIFPASSTCALGTAFKVRRDDVGVAGGGIGFFGVGAGTGLRVAIVAGLADLLAFGLAATGLVTALGGTSFGVAWGVGGVTAFTGALLPGSRPLASCACDGATLK